MQKSDRQPALDLLCLKDDELGKVFAKIAWIASNQAAAIGGERPMRRSATGRLESALERRATMGRCQARWAASVFDDPVHSPSRSSNPLYPWPSGGADAEGMKKEIPAIDVQPQWRWSDETDPPPKNWWIGEEPIWSAPELDFGDGQVLVLDAGDPFPVDDLPVFAHH